MNEHASTHGKLMTAENFDFKNNEQLVEKKKNQQ